MDNYQQNLSEKADQRKRFNQFMTPYVEKFAFARAKEDQHKVAQTLANEWKNLTKELTLKKSEETTRNDDGTDTNKGNEVETEQIGGRGVLTEHMAYNYLNKKASVYVKKLIHDMEELAVEDPDEFIDQYEIPNVINSEDIPCVASVDIYDKVTFGPNRNPDKCPAFEFRVTHGYEITPVC